MLLPYLYTLLYHATIHGHPVIRPVVFEFPSEPGSFDVEYQFMWGSGLLIIPNLQEKTDSIEIWIPPGRWYEFYSGQTLERETNTKDKTRLPAPDLYIILYMRAGHIIPTQDVNGLTTKKLRSNSFTLYVGLDCDKSCSAEGIVYLDDGESITGPSMTTSFTATNYSLVVTPESKDPKTYDYVKTHINANLGKVIFYGIHEKPANVTMWEGDKTIIDDHIFTYDVENSVLKIQNITQINLADGKVYSIRLEY